MGSHQRLVNRGRTWLPLAVTHNIDSLIIAYIFSLYYKGIKSIIATQSTQTCWKVKSLWQTVHPFLRFSWSYIACSGRWSLSDLVQYVMPGKTWKDLEHLLHPLSHSVAAELLAEVVSHEVEAAFTNHRESCPVDWPNKEGINFEFYHSYFSMAWLILLQQQTSAR